MAPESLAARSHVGKLYLSSIVCIVIIDHPHLVGQLANHYHHQSLSGHHASPSFLSLSHRCSSILFCQVIVHAPRRHRSFSARVSQGERWLEDIAKCQRFPSSSCSPIAYIFRRIQTSHSNVAFEHHIFSHFSQHSSIISFPALRS